MQLETITGSIATTFMNEKSLDVNRWVGLSIILFFLWFTTIILLNRRIEEVKKLREKIKNYEDDII